MDDFFSAVNASCNLLHSSIVIFRLWWPRGETFHEFGWTRKLTLGRLKYLLTGVFDIFSDASFVSIVLHYSEFSMMFLFNIFDYFLNDLYVN